MTDLWYPRVVVIQKLISLLCKEIHEGTGRMHKNNTLDLVCADILHTVHTYTQSFFFITIIMIIIIIQKFITRA